MKKFILSATLALACFTAQAKNEVIKNDDDKNPKAKAKVAKVVPTAPCTAAATYKCASGSSVSVSYTGENCFIMLIKIMKYVEAEAC